MGRALGLVVLAGAALRFATLDAQSLWYDEAVTAQLLRMDLSGLLHAISASESTPPLYYLLAWGWTHALGTGEAGMRSLSALFGTATIAVAWALGRRLGGDRAGLIAAALVSVNPMLIWFSQEARAYALLALLAALAALAWLRALERPSARRAASWAVVAALALATHYYALFLIAPMALWLVLRAPDRRVRAAALAPPALALAALAPLALHQRANDSAAFIRDESLLTRVAQVPKQLLVGYDSPAETLLAVLSLLLLLIAAAGVWRLLAPGTAVPARESEPARLDVLRLTAIAAAALLLPALAALAGEDHLITRNLLAVAPLGAALAGAGFAAVVRTRAALGRAAIAAACAIGVVAAIGVDADPALQRDDWRGVARSLGAVTQTRLIAVTPASSLIPLRYYMPGLRQADPPSIVTGEVDYVAVARRRPGERPKPARPAVAPAPGPGYVLVQRSEGETFTVLRLTAPAPGPQPVGPVPGLDGTPAAVLTIAPR
jgi:4-amino-4-deoxy-L-arabinose transferase-like glycosyltransferase